MTMTKTKTISGILAGYRRFFTKPDHTRHTNLNINGRYSEEDVRDDVGVRWATGTGHVSDLPVTV
jgi:hypothetical protein